MDWASFIFAILIAWEGIDLGRAIEKKNTVSVVFNAILIIIDCLFILFN